VVWSRGRRSDVGILDMEVQEKNRVVVAKKTEV